MTELWSNATEHCSQDASDWRLGWSFPVVWAAFHRRIPGVSIVSNVSSGADRRKHQSSASLAFVREIYRSPVNSPHKGPETRKMFSFDDVIIIMTTLLVSVSVSIYRTEGQYCEDNFHAVSLFSHGRHGISNYRQHGCLPNSFFRLTTKEASILHNIILLWWESTLQIANNGESHEDGTKWKHFPRYWSFVRGIHRPAVNSPHKGQWRGASMFSLISAWISGWINNREAGDLRRHRAHYDVTVMHIHVIISCPQAGVGSVSRGGVNSVSWRSPGCSWCACHFGASKSASFSRVSN